MSCQASGRRVPNIQAVYCDRRWQAGLRSGATSLFDVRCSMFDVGRSSFKRIKIGPV